MQCIGINWLCKRRRKVRSRQISILINSCTELSKTQFTLWVPSNHSERETRRGFEFWSFKQFSSKFRYPKLNFLLLFISDFTSVIWIYKLGRKCTRLENMCEVIFDRQTWELNQRLGCNGKLHNKWRVEVSVIEKILQHRCLQNL